MMIPFWLEARACLAARKSREEILEEIQMLTGTQPVGLREWTARGVPPDLPDALLRAEFRVLAVLTTDPDGTHVTGDGDDREALHDALAGDAPGT